MMRARLAALALGLVAVFLVVLDAPAHADYGPERSADSCTGYWGEGHVCLTVWWERDSDNVGFKLNSVEVWGCDGISNCIHVNGSTLTCYNQDKVVKFSEPGDALDYGRGLQQFFYPNQTWPGATELTCRFTGSWKNIVFENFTFSPRIVDRT